MSREVSYDVYVKDGVDSLGRDNFGEAVAHFVERGNAVALKRRLETRGETVRIERNFVHGLSEADKERWFSDYSRVPEYELSRETAPSQEVLQEPLGAPASIAERPKRAEPRSATRGAQESAEHVSWWRRVFGA